MVEAAATEFWRNIKPINKVLKPEALLQAYVANAPIDDERYYAPLSDTVASRPLWISPTLNQWCDILWAKKAELVIRHYYQHPAMAYTISGKGGYLEYDWIATARDFIYETPGESHTFVAYDYLEPMRVFFHLHAPLIWLDEDGNSNGNFDVHDYVTLCKAHYEEVGLDADMIARLLH